MKDKTTMKIIALTSNNINEWKSQVFPLLKETVIYNFQDYEVPDSYYEDEWNEVEDYIKVNKAFIFLAVENNRVAGWIWMHLINRFSKRRLHVAFFAVYPEFRGKGVGRYLLDSAEKKAKELKLEGIDLFVTASNSVAVNFYKHNGFEPERYLLYKGLDHDN